MTEPSPHTPRRGIRIPEVLWRRVQAKAKEEGRTVSDVIRTLLERWVDR